MMNNKIVFLISFLIYWFYFIVDVDDEDFDDDKVDFEKPTDDNTEKSLADLLNVNANNNDDYYGYEEEEDY